jgi:WD40 repeat protein
LPGGVFISYRRDDSAGFAGRIYDRLKERLGRADVFFDVDNIEPGVDFVEVLSERVGACDALVAIIGKNWLSSANADGGWRLDDPHDYVRIEVEAALARNVRVIPALIEGARMPKPEELPVSLQMLARRQAVQISHDRFDSDADRLTRALEFVQERQRARKADAPVRGAALVAPGSSPPRGERTSSAPAGGRNRQVSAAVAGVVFAGGVATISAIYFRYIERQSTTTIVQPVSPPGREIGGRTPPSLERTLTASTGAAQAVAFSPDGRTLASGSGDGPIQLWDPATGHLIRTLTGHIDSVSSVGFSPDGQTLVSAGKDHIVRLWDVVTGRIIRTANRGNRWLWAAAFSPDGRTVAAASDDTTISLWSIDHENAFQTLTGHTSGVLCVTFSPDGRTLASGSWDKTIKLWNVATASELHTLSGHTAPVWSVAFSPDNRILASGGFDGRVKLWNAESGQLIRTLAGHTDEVRSVVFSPDGWTLASGAQDDAVKLWNVASGAELLTLTVHSAVISVAFSPDGRRLASANNDGTVTLWGVSADKSDR